MATNRPATLFPSLTFILFFLVVFPVAWTLGPPRRRWQAFMLLASYAFYAAWDWRFVPLLVGSTLVNASLARRVDPPGLPAGAAPSWLSAWRPTYRC